MAQGENRMVNCIGDMEIKTANLKRLKTKGCFLKIGDVDVIYLCVGGDWWLLKIAER